VCVLALSQTKGRGRLGRVWEQSQAPGTASSPLGLAITFALDAQRHDAVRLPLRAGLAAREACERTLRAGTLGERTDLPGEPDRAFTGLRWPNDVVERVPIPGCTPPVRRKLAGVLIERRGGVLLLGVGVNVLQQADDFPPALRTRAASLAMLAGPGTRAGEVSPLTVAVELIQALHAALATPGEALAHRWHTLDTLVGETRTFAHDANLHTGTVEAIEPDSHILIRRACGTVVRLPALTTSLVHDEPGAAPPPPRAG
jgi:biotin-(acetyl-CoA carboxylase) ligase